MIITWTLIVMDVAAEIWLIHRLVKMIFGGRN